ncbi:MAG: type II secretion system protein [bacterium]|nr:type II secretion system protein [bacterium]
MKRLAFTLAEVLITLAIIGVVAAVSIPSVISNSQQQEFKTGLRKAVSVLNSAITMNMALDGETPYDNGNLYGYLMKHMAVIETTYMPNKYSVAAGGTGPNGESQTNTYPNYAFYTTDGMRFEFNHYGKSQTRFKLYENPSIYTCTGATTYSGEGSWHNWDGSLQEGIKSCGGCGSLGLNNNSDNTTKPPCLIMVDVNGDRKPSPTNVNCKGSGSCATTNTYKFSDPEGKKLTDVFTIMITDKEAVPYGIAAQKAMYQSRK